MSSFVLFSILRNLFYLIIFYCVGKHGIIRLQEEGDYRVSKTGIGK